MEPKVKYKGGGSFVVKAPQFSADGQTLYLVRKNVILSYNTKTSNRLRELKGLHDPIVGFNVHFVNDFEYITACSTKGEIISWKAEMGFKVLRAVVPLNDVNIESFSLITPTMDVSEDNRKFLLSYTSSMESDKNVYFGVFSFVNKKWLGLMEISRDKYKPIVGVSRSQNPFFTVVQGRRLYFMRVNDRFPYIHNTDKDKHFTCVTCHPEEECVLTGDSLGRIMLWYNLTTKQPSRAIYHWHTLPVRTLSFSYSGTMFYSGAGECVLVKWYLDDPYQKEFLPRLRSTIEHVTVASENQFVALGVATADNAVQILDPQFETINIIQDLVLGTHFPAGIVFDHRTKSMVLNGLTGQVQFYSPHDAALLYNLDIVGQNKLTQERDCHIENTNVTKISISDCGIWLATVEERVDISYSFELRLKFWVFNSVKQLFELNTSVELPHDKSITSLLFQPSYDEDLRCVTVANDKKFKIWQLVNADTIYNKGNAWQCVRVGFYRDLPCSTLAFSCDGSLLSVGFGPTVTTWLPETCELKCSLLHPGNRERITSLQFGTSNQCHLLVAATSEQLSVWNLLSLTMVWTVPLQVSLLVANSVFPHMAVFTTDGKLFIFNPGSSQPVYTQSLEKGTDNIVAAVFIPTTSSSDANLNWYQGSQLHFISSKQELFCLDAEEEIADSISIFSDSLNQGLFSSMQAKAKTGTGVSHQYKPVKHLTDISCKNQELKQLLDAPVHTMIPIRLTCGSLLRSMILEHKLPEANVT